MKKRDFPAMVAVNPVSDNKYAFLLYSLSGNIFVYFLYQSL